ncbi:unnamed protein product, partial [Vitis vinifera]|uniref:Uncharacterized protein n=1 Tax=Vitis vinifera TaxID=29760 RepID=D7U8Z8_VITVI
MKKRKLATCCLPLSAHFPVCSLSSLIFYLSPPLNPSFPVFPSLLLHSRASSPLAVSRALISTLLHRRPSCPP